MNHYSAYLIVICESFNMKNPSKQMHKPRDSSWARSADEQHYMTNTGLARRITMSCPSVLGCAFQMGCVHPLVRDRSSSKPQPGSMPYKLGVRPAPNNRERGTTWRLHNRSTVCSIPQHTQRTQLVILDMCILLLGTNRNQGHLQYRLETNDIKGMFNTLDSDQDKMFKCQFPT